MILEVVFGFTLVLVAILSIFQLFVSSDSLVAVADRTAQADQIARRLLEEELHVPYDDVEPSKGSETVPHVDRRGTTVSTVFDYEVSIQQPDPAKEVKLISVKVSWGERPRRTLGLVGAKGENW